MDSHAGATGTQWKDGSVGSPLKKDNELRIAALRAEQAAVRSIEAAMIARLAGDATRELTERAKAVMAASTLAAQKASEAADKAIKEKEEAEKAAKEAAAATLRTAEAKDLAEASVTKLKNAKKTVVEETAQLEAEMKAAKAANTAAEKENVVLAAKAREAMTQVKYATRTLEKAQMTVQQAQAAVQTAAMALTKAEQQSVLRQEEADIIAKEVGPRQDEEEELADALAMAERTAAEYAGTGSTWEVRTQETLKERQIEHARAKNELEKAKKGEENANNLVQNAIKAVEQATRTHESAVKRLAQEQQLYDEANAAMQKETVICTAASERAEQSRKECADAMAMQEAMSEKLKNLKISASGAAMASAEEDLRRAIEMKENADRHQAKLAQQAHSATEAMGRALAAKERAIQDMEAKQLITAKALEKELEADQKKKLADGFVEDLDAKVHLLAQAELNARGLTMSPQEIKEAAEMAKERKEAAIRDIRQLTKVCNTDKITPIDKWRAFLKWSESGQPGAEHWNVRRLFYALDGSFLSALDVMVKDVVGRKLDRGSVNPKLCRCEGEGLAQASQGQTASFSITAFSTHGIAFGIGGDAFTVGIRYAGLAMSVRSKIVDNDDGTYTVLFKPTSSGKLLINVSYNGENFSGSPFVCTVSSPTPCASQCIVSGDAVNRVVAYKPEKFFISFRDALGHVAHAGELDVWVHPVEGDKAVPVTQKVNPPQETLSEVGRLIEPLHEFEYLVVGTKPLDVTRARDANSEKIGKLLPGRTLKIVRIEPLEDGVLRACIVVEKEEPRHDEDPGSWRLLWPSRQEWRTPDIGRSSRKKMDAISQAAKQLAIEEAAATKIATIFRGRKDRRFFAHKVAEREAERKAAAKAVQEAAMRAAQEAKRAKMAAASDRDRKMAESGISKASKGRPAPMQAESPGKGVVPPEEDKKKDKKKDKKDEPQTDTKSDKSSKSEKDEKSATTLPDAAIAIETDKATDKAVGEQAASAADPKAKKKGDGSGTPPASKKGKGKKGKGFKTPKHEDPVPEGRPLTKPKLNLRDDKKFGWVTLVIKDEPLVTRLTKRLPAHVRQQFLTNWSRRVAIDSERERERALLRDRDAEEGTAKGREEVMNWVPPYLTGGLLSGRGYSSPRLYSVPEGPEKDPQMVGFSYGGVYPGRLHAHGQLIETHEVQFSVGVAGNYLLYVSLRQPNGQSSPLDNVPGSPFYLHVSPGPAHPLSTGIPPNALPLRGLKDKKEGRFVCEFMLITSDKMGNRCVSGGAAMTCGFLDVTNAGLDGAEELMDDVTTRNSKCTDNGDGTYLCKWVSETAAELYVYVKLDGLHVLGSPNVLRFGEAKEGKD